MSETTNISYVDHTWSPWRGCSMGCPWCYAAALAKRAGKAWAATYGKGARVEMTKDWKKLMRWQKRAATLVNSWETWKKICGLHDSQLIDEGFIKPRSPRVFPSLCDWLDPNAPIEALARFLDLIRCTPNLNWLLLTKVPGLWEQRVGEACESLSNLGPMRETKSMLWHWLGEPFLAGSTPPSNLWLGTSISYQADADARIPALLKIPARLRWLSIEPMMGPVDVSKWRAQNGWDALDWIVIGGMSGPAHKKFPLKIEWVRNVVEQCKAASVPCYVKQDSGPRPGMQGRLPDELWSVKEMPR